MKKRGIVDLLDVDGRISNVHEEEIMEAIYQAISQPRTKRRHNSASRTELSPGESVNEANMSSVSLVAGHRRYRG